MPHELLITNVYVVEISQKDASLTYLFAYVVELNDFEIMQYI